MTSSGAEYLHSSRVYSHREAGLLSRVESACLSTADAVYQQDRHLLMRESAAAPLHPGKCSVHGSRPLGGVAVMGVICRNLRRRLHMTPF